MSELARLLASAPPGVAQAAAAVRAAAGEIASSAAEAAVAEPDEGLHLVKSPIVGTFYGSPSPGASGFVSPGDHVDKGQVICIVEAMKLMNEIESDAGGEIVKCFVSNGQPIEFGQPLFSVRLGEVIGRASVVSGVSRVHASSRQTSSAGSARTASSA